jgi:hypothetical protein
MSRLGRVSWVAFAVLLVVLMFSVSANADFGFVPGSVAMTPLNKDGTLDTVAGSHPDSVVLRFSLNRTASGESEGGELRNVLVKLPPGLIGNPHVVPACSEQLFEVEGESCPVDTQIGVLRADIPGLGVAAGPLYNIVAPNGSASEFGFKTAGFISRQFFSVRSEEDYGVSVGAINSPIPTTGIEETVWGEPADPEHDHERGVFSFNGGPPVPSTAEPVPYLTLPTSCNGGAPKTTVEIDSVQEPEDYVSQTVEMLDAGGDPARMTGCEVVPFSPTALLQPTSGSASTATGFGFELGLPDAGLLNSEEGAIVETQPRKAVITLPAGMTVNPSVAVGLETCSEAQYDAEHIETSPNAGCPVASKIGDVIAHSPLIEEQVEGSIFLAAPYANPSKTLLGMYLVARAKDRGVLVKQAGRIDLDPNTGQVTATFDNLPPLPYSSFHVQLREGTRAPLVTPPACGTYTSTGTFTPFSAENETDAKTIPASFQIQNGADGTACPPGGVPPFAPVLTAGSVNNAAGHYSPLYLRIERKDGEQEITGFSTQLPSGLTGNLSGVPFCGNTEIQHAREQSGSEAETSPACPQASLIGHSVAEAGVGNVLAQTPGNLYLGGAFEGAPFSVVSVTAAKVGPFDLGTVVVHLPLKIDPVTAQVSIPSGPADQIPHILKGVVIHLRAINITVDRERFMLNPTNCQTMSITDTIDGSGVNVASPADDTAASSTSRYQLADCANLAFKPTFKASTSGKTSRQNGASLHVTLTYPKNSLGSDANIHEVKVDLPKQLPSRLTTLQKACTAHQFEVDPAGCPAASRVGTAKALTPVLPVPLEGPAYFVSYGSAQFPELVVVLQGYGVTIDLHGETFISKAGITSSTFRTIPDQPVTSFELTLPEGPNSALAAPTKLCNATTTKTVKKTITIKSDGHKRKITRNVKSQVPATLTIPTMFIAQNGATYKQSTPITVTGCTKKTTKKTKKIPRRKK